MTGLRSTTLALAVAAATALSAGAAWAQDTLRIGTEGAYPPFNMVDENGNLHGFDIDIANALCAQMERECTFVIQDWDGIIPGLLAGKYDAVIASMSVTEERKQAVDFTDKYWTNKLQFIAPKSVDLDLTPEGMAGTSVGAQRATISAQWVEENMPDVDVKLYDTQENAYLDLGTGRIDAVIADKLVNYEWLESDAGADFEFKGEPVYENDLIAIALRKGNEDLLADFNAALTAIRENGTYAEINAKYFPFDIY
ncbi:ABC transporter substrate-binding protein [Roseospira marina]|uniref:ABC transporter substrate-binding protein n=1 Tax=Roseospira marina TaxID=140057 RepID=A0A5M6ID91_9PROT|nr:ABC transporter substrate-binding protein [Roseospira marina]KAA5605588.1 ABC transporter substrate-binding protein [Roseospira marina]MBB4313346.1 polar amino acid transport system substrate-binding protein [Roseospira marina]MBB5085913.1 polar amino acid transport system substrate-binding protein [Roseospira marina]